MHICVPCHRQTLQTRRKHISSLSYMKMTYDHLKNKNCSGGYRRKNCVHIRMSNLFLEINQQNDVTILKKKSTQRKFTIYFKEVD